MPPTSALPPATRHLADRFAYGVNDALRADLRKGGAAWFEAQLRRSEPQTLQAELVPLWFPALKNPAPLNALLDRTGIRPSRVVAGELITQTLARRVLSRHQVYETMVDFWSNLLYVPAGEGRWFSYRPAYDDVVRRHALTDYRSLLQATVVHPAMTAFLDNDLNRRDGLNENLGRELLELHTVGRRYTESDVRNTSRLLTGFTLGNGLARYDAGRHHRGRVQVLGFTHPNSAADGRPALDALLSYLAGHPATARRVAQRLCVRFVDDEPPRAVVEAVATAYRRSGTNIPATLRALVRHPQFRAAQRSKVWTPSDDVVRSARVMGLTPTGAPTDDSFVHSLARTALDMGHLSLLWPRPDGWPETSSDYLSASRVLRSWRHHYDLAATRSDLFRNVRVSSKESQLPRTWPRTLAQLVDHQAERLVGRPASDALVDAVAGALGVRPRHRYRDADALPDRHYQLLRGTVLNSPAGLQR
ncbi:MAG: hypothetical protein JWN84_4191 [Nocardioides sp.]|nr:hypothetical protein [Nocardioides sp.]